MFRWSNFIWELFYCETKYVDLIYFHWSLTDGNTTQVDRLFITCQTIHFLMDKKGKTFKSKSQQENFVELYKII